MATYRVRSDGKEYEVTVEEDGLGGATVSVEGERFHVEPAAGAPAAVPAAPAPAAPTLAPSAPSPAARPAAPAAAKAPAGSGSITAPIPGVVTTLLVKVGDTVQAGQIVLKLEAMKMENDIASPVDGTVKEVAVAEGAQVGDGQLLMVVA